MKVSALLKELQAVDPDLEVRLWTDHGQASMLASVSGEMYIPAKCETDEDHA